MHLFIITAFTRWYNDEQRDAVRAKELRESVASVRRKVPTDTFIIINEGSSFVHEDNLGADKVMYTNVKGWHKSHGDLYLFMTGWLSESHRENIETVSKLSGRYLLLDEFDWNMEPIETNIVHTFSCETVNCRLRLTTGCFNVDTFYFRFHSSTFNHVLTECQKIHKAYSTNRNLPDIEHMMFINKVFETAPKTTKRLHVGGMCAGNNLWKHC
jgi:hypothetical protein